MKTPPTISHIKELEKSITLERKHFVLTINDTISDRVNNLVEDYDMKKNILIGYIISDHFQNIVDLNEDKNIEPRKIVVQVNESLKKKMDKFTEDNYIPLNALVSYSIMNGPYSGFPSYEDNNSVKFFTNIPIYLWEEVKEKAEEQNIREHFYTSLCIYKQFMTPEGRFFEEKKGR